MIKPALLIYIVNQISAIIGIAAILIITWGAFIIFIDLIKLEFNRFKGIKLYYERTILRHRFGSYLLLGLEFLIAADVILTISQPSLEEITILASIVGIRTVISYFLDKEIVYSEKRGNRGKHN
ncbi:MAG: hypothetical protein APR54_12215 [Candidatus Cloacimonas sp. SDB]|nr:MAG: hypothetical protein APR54_12215 [Candidatus Cloacimonas sp. SDB]